MSEITIHYPLPQFVSHATMRAEQLLAFHKNNFGDARMEVEGEGDTEDTGGNPDTGAASQDVELPPPGTPVTEMSEKQAVAYFKAQNAKKSATLKSLRAENAALQEKAQQFDALDNASKSEHERALDEARKTAKAEGEAAARQTLQPLLVRAEFKAAAAGRIEQQRLDDLLDPLDMSKFLDDEGQVDTAKVSAWVDSAAPKQDGKGSGFPDLGQGRRQGTPQPSVASGQALYDQRHKKQTVNT